MKHWIFKDVQNTEYRKGLEAGVIKYVSTKHPASKRLNNKLEYLKSLAEDVLKSLRMDLKSMDVNDLKKLVQDKLENPDLIIETTTIEEIDEKDSFLTPLFKLKMAECQKGGDQGTYQSYKQSLSLFLDFVNDEFKTHDIRVSKVDLQFLNTFVQYCKSEKRGVKKKGMTGEGMKPNSISVRLRSLRHIVNRAIKDKTEKITLAEYPFQDFKMPKNETPKRTIQKEDIEKLRELELKRNSAEWHHRNYFLFMFNNQGMNYVDLAYLKKEQIVDGRLMYERTKTRGTVVFNIELTPESIEILEMYNYKGLRGDELVFPILTDIYGYFDTAYTYERYKGRLKTHNKYLKKLANKIGLESKLTSYVARHTWASVGFNEFESLDVIGQGLGHINDPKVTKIYAKDLDRKRVDEVNKTITKRETKINTIG